MLALVRRTGSAGSNEAIRLEAKALQDAADGSGRDADFGSDLLASLLATARLRPARQWPAA
ncbi:hypothetical protein MESS2_890001 [Mesorhizobium metallidurans STM 2683]|uniref:Uncharacterized protein n=1 Tax=Mesorhizobium metallidurans STM 2683 TaxID=1297569 RepID=M5EYD2_9HYPH|nr:hypothetical protein MESS2_890001 [Mesorhizobium metallidurans STM 2683]